MYAYTHGIWNKNLLVNIHNQKGLETILVDSWQSIKVFSYIPVQKNVIEWGKTNKITTN